MSDVTETKVRKQEPFKRADQRSVERGLRKLRSAHVIEDLHCNLCDVDV